ncbi:conjugal transfer protein TraK, partial [Flavobacterium sp. IR1]
MKTPYQNIYAVLKLNRFVVIAVVICAFSSSIFSGWIAFSINKRALNSAFAVNTNGEVIPLKLVSQKENFRVEALAH